MKRKKEGIDRNEEGKRQSEINLGCVEEKWACQSNDAGPDACAGIRSFKSLSPASIKVCSIKKKRKNPRRDPSRQTRRGSPMETSGFGSICSLLSNACLLQVTFIQEKKACLACTTCRWLLSDESKQLPKSFSSGETVCGVLLFEPSTRVLGIID